MSRPPPLPPKSQTQEEDEYAPPPLPPKHDTQTHTFAPPPLPPKQDDSYYDEPEDYNTSAPPPLPSKTNYRNTVNLSQTQSQPKEETSKKSSNRMSMKLPFGKSGGKIGGLFGSKKSGSSSSGSGDLISSSQVSNLKFAAKTGTALTNTVGADNLAKASNYASSYTGAPTVTASQISTASRVSQSVDFDQVARTANTAHSVGNKVNDARKSVNNGNFGNLGNSAPFLPPKQGGAPPLPQKHQEDSYGRASPPPLPSKQYGDSGSSAPPLPSKHNGSSSSYSSPPPLPSKHGDSNESYGSAPPPPLPQKSSYESNAAPPLPRKNENQPPLPAKQGPPAPALPQKTPVYQEETHENPFDEPEEVLSPPLPVRDLPHRPMPQPQRSSNVTTTAPPPPLPQKHPNPFFDDDEPEPQQPQVQPAPVSAPNISHRQSLPVPPAKKPLPTPAPHPNPNPSRGVDSAPSQPALPAKPPTTTPVSSGPNPGSNAPAPNRPLPVPKKRTESVVAPPSLPPKSPFVDQEFPDSQQQHNNRLSMRPRAQSAASLPTRVVSTGWGKTRTIGEPTYGQFSSFLRVQEGVLASWHLKWVVFLDDSILFFKRQDDLEPYWTLSLDCITEAELAPYMKKPLAFHLLYFNDAQSTKERHLYLQADNEEDLNQWIGILNPKPQPKLSASDNAVPSHRPQHHASVKLSNDAPHVPLVPLSDVQRQVHAHIEKEKAHALSSSKDLQNSILKGSVLSASICPGGKSHETFVSYTIFLSFVGNGCEAVKSGKLKDESWSINRRYRQFYDLYCALRSGGLDLECIFPEKTMGKSKKKNYTAEFTEERRKLLHLFVTETCDKFSQIVNDENLYHNCAVFFGPYQMGDTKPPNFISPMPLFKL